MILGLNWTFYIYFNEDDRYIIFWYLKWYSSCHLKSLYFGNVLFLINLDFLKIGHIQQLLNNPDSITYVGSNKDVSSNKYSLIVP